MRGVKKIMSSKVQRKDRKYKNLSGKQKARIADKTYLAYLRFYLEHNRMPDVEDTEIIYKKIFQSVKVLAPMATFEEFEEICEKRVARYEERIKMDCEKGITLEILNGKHRKKTPEEKTIALKQKAEMRKIRRAKRKQEQSDQIIDQNDTFFFIAGYTSGGAPFGVTWEEMGLEPWQEIR